MAALAAKTTLNREAFDNHFSNFWGAHEWPEDAVLVISYAARKPLGDKKVPLSSKHVSIHDAHAIWAEIVKIGSTRKIWISVAPRSMKALQSRIEENQLWNAENGEEIRQWNKENAAEIKARPSLRKRPKVTDLEWMRGTASECYPMPGLFLDADVDEVSSEHTEHRMDKASGDRDAKILPSREQVDRWLAEFPMKPTVKIWTGGGYHLWWAFLVLLSADEQAKFLSRFKSHWVNIAASSGMHIDVGTVEAVRVGRPAGTIKGKGDDEIFFSVIDTVEVNPEARFSTKDMEFLPEFHDPKRSRGVRNANGSVVSRPVSPRTQAEQNALPGTKLSHSLPVSVILEDVMKFERSGDSFAAPWRMNYVPGKVDVYLYTAEDGAELAKFYDEGEAHDRGLEASVRSYSSFGLLINCYCAGDTHLAARIAAHYEEDVDALVELLQTLPTPEALTEQFPEPAPKMCRLPTASSYEDDYIPDPPDRETILGEVVDVSEETQAEINEISAAIARRTIRDAIRDGVPYEYQISERYMAKIGGPDTGLWEIKYLNDGPAGAQTQQLHQKTTWVAWRPTVSEPFMIDVEGNPIPAAEAKFSVQVVKASGYTKVAHGLTAKESDDCLVVNQKMNAGLRIPVDVTEKKIMDNLLRELGFDDQEQKDEYTSTGILRNPDGKHVYLMPAGSVTADGITYDYTVGGLAGSGKGSLKPAQTAAGFERVPAAGAEIRAAALAINAFYTLVPSRPEAATAGLGAIFAGPLPMARHASFAVLGRPYTGKSLFTSALQCFVSGVTPNGSDFSATLATRATVAGIGNANIWHTLSVGFYDDFRFAKGKENDVVQACFNLTVQNSYGTDGPTHANGEGGNRTARTAWTTSIVSGEGAPDSGIGIHSRYLMVTLEHGQVEISPRGTSAFDRFVDDFANTGEARALNAAYVQWLMGKIDEAGSLSAYKRIVDRRKKQWESGTEGRASEVASVFATGWALFHDFAEDHGIADLLPKMEDISAQLIKMATINETSAAEQTDGRVMLSWIVDRLGGSGYLTDHRLKMPDYELRELLGWEQNEHGYSHGNRTLVGHLSKCGRFIHVPSKVVQDAKSFTGRSGMGAAQTVDAFRDLVAPGTLPGAKAKASLRLLNEIRGYTFPVETFNLACITASVETGIRESAKRDKPGVITPSRRSAIDEMAQRDSDDF